VMLRKCETFNVLVSFMFYGVLSDLCFPWNILAQGLQSCFCVLHAVSILKTHPPLTYFMAFVSDVFLLGYTLINSFLACSSSPSKSWISFRFTAAASVPSATSVSPPWR
jgi:hypothetical protein